MATTYSFTQVDGHIQIEKSVGGDLAETILIHADEAAINYGNSVVSILRNNEVIFTFPEDELDTPATVDLLFAVFQNP